MAAGKGIPSLLKRNPLLKKVVSAIRCNDMFAPGDAVVVALSGGADSVALLHILLGLAEYGSGVVAAHLNHRLRGAESDEDENFVRALCQKHDVPLVVRGIDVGHIARERGLSLEEAGRECRYSFFKEVAADFGAKTVALAHHADDQAETVLMRLLRGSGGTGLRGMLPRSPDGCYVRPLLRVTRKEIEEYLANEGVRYRVDSSNSDIGFLRNRIRHELIPFLGGYNPAIAERLQATADLLASDEELLEVITERLFERHSEVTDAGVTIDLAGVRTEPKGARLRLYRLAVERAKGDLRKIQHRHIVDMDRLVHDAKPHMALTLPDGLRVRKSYGSLTVTAAKEITQVGWEVVIDGPGIYQLSGGFALSVARAEVGGAYEDVSCARFDLEKAPFPWLVRNFRNGDRLNPFGMTGSKKVKELFIDRKIPIEERRRIPLLFCAETLLWVCGIRIGSTAAVTHVTKSLAVASIRYEGP